MKRIHYVSGLIIACFVGLHLINHAVSITGAESHIACMNQLQSIYRTTAGETILLGAVLLQVISGIRMFFRQRQSATGFFEKLQLWSGLYLAIFFVIHLGAVFAGRYILHLDTNFYFGVAGLNTFPHNLFFIPYYALAILSFFGHLAAIHHKKMKRKVMGLPVDLQSKLVLATGVVLTLVIFYGLTNGLNGVEIPEEYNLLIGK
ncbi:hypothetical protein INQ51_02895 [Maribellus sp. CM-23]|uniref:hypothetical protein n=1 Tax=Maribellus sp. CM-23 TaxID=2781026 RepID=UPI001F469482|nr:hypothetical protein [Maribellus sp. CM-23]MCE4563248.1 hypothetical protein [Maribellus sp. CM-23]